MAAVGFPNVILGHEFDPCVAAAVAGAECKSGGDAACFAAFGGVVGLVATDAAFFANLGEDVVVCRDLRFRRRAP